MSSPEGHSAPAAAAAAAAVPDPAEPTLIVSNMDVTYKVRGQDRLALRDVSFTIGRGESYGLVGESGSGKSTAALALVRYLPRNGRVSGGTIRINGRDPLAMGTAALRDLRSHTVSMVYQEPGRALNPSIRVGRQIAEVFEIEGESSGAATKSAEEMLRKVQISDPARVMGRYPHELSGGMAQRAVIAMALAKSPSLLILDEPTTALDATVEAEVLDLVAALRQEFRTSILFISHNLAVIAKMCDRVGVLYAGELLEQGPARQVFDDPRHPYTVGLLRCIPRRGQRKDRDRLDTIPGFLPAPGHSLTGCIFAPRCGLAQDRCRAESPPFFDVGDLQDRALLLPRPGAGAAPGHAVVGARAGHRRDRRPDRGGREAVEDLPRRRPGAGRGRPDRAPGRDARPGRRVGQRQDHAGPGPARADRAGPGLGRHPGGQAAQPGRAAPAAGDPARAADRVPEPRLGAEPAALGAQPDQPPADPAGRALRDGAAGPAGRADRLGPAGGPPPGAAPLPAVRRPEAAGRDRARLRPPAGRGGLRRADVRAGRVGAGGHLEPAGRSAAAGARHATCSSRTTWAWSGTCRTGSWCCTSGG